MPYIVSHCVDYLAFTLNSPAVFFADKAHDFTPSPNRNYNMCELLESGALHMWHTIDQRVGHHYVYPGKPLSYLRQHGENDLQMVQWCLEKSRISRIDIALTSQPEDENKTHGFTPHLLAWACRDLQLVSRLTPAKDITHMMKTETKYIGSHKSRNRLFRAYDKGIQTGHVPNFLIRYELETGKGTKTMARNIVSGEPFGAIMRRYVDFPANPTWLEIMSAEPARVRHEERVLSAEEMDELKSESRWQWLSTSIPRTVKKALKEDRRKFGIAPQDNENFQHFIHTILEQMET